MAETLVELQLQSRSLLYCVASLAEVSSTKNELPSVLHLFEEVAQQLLGIFHVAVHCCLSLQHQGISDSVPHSGLHVC